MQRNLTQYMPGVSRLVKEFEEKVSEVLGHKVKVSVSLSSDVTCETLVQIISEECGIDPRLLFNHSKKREVVVARQLIILYAIGLCGYKPRDLGVYFNIHQSNINHLLRDAANHLHAKDQKYCFYNERVKQRLFA